jgi:hypothetical protein
MFLEGIRKEKIAAPALPASASRTTQLTTAMRTPGS